MNITPKDYNKLSWTERRQLREQYIEEQNGNCQYCGCSLDSSPSEQVTKLAINVKLFPEEFFKYPVHLHHDHETNMTIGAVHNVCNAVLWQYEGK